MCPVPMTSKFLLCCAASLAAVLSCPSVASAADAGIGPSFKGIIGLQLYSLRDQFPKDVMGTLDEVKGWGIHYAELAGTYGLSAGIHQATRRPRHQTHRRPL